MSQAAGDDECIGNGCQRFHLPLIRGNKAESSPAGKGRDIQAARTGSAEDCAWQCRGHDNLESSLPTERCLTLACIVSSSCAEAKARGTAAESFVFGRTRCMGIGAFGFGLASVYASACTVGGRPCREDSLCRRGLLGFGSAWGFLHLL